MGPVCVPTRVQNAVLHQWVFQLNELYRLFCNLSLLLDQPPPPPLLPLLLLFPLSSLSPTLPVASLDRPPPLASDGQYSQLTGDSALGSEGSMAGQRQVSDGVDDLPLPNDATTGVPAIDTVSWSVLLSVCTVWSILHWSVLLSVCTVWSILHWSVLSSVCTVWSVLHWSVLLSLCTVWSVLH